MEWQINPLLREEIEAARKEPKVIPLLYQWSAGAGVTVLTWKRQAISAVYPGG